MKRCASFEFCFLKVKTKPALPLAFSIATQALRVNRMYKADFAHEIPLTSPNGVSPFNTHRLCDDASQALGQGKILECGMVGTHALEFPMRFEV
jgi:hypothetical protein